MTETSDAHTASVFSPYQAELAGLDEAQVTAFCEAVNTGHRDMGLVSPFGLYDDILSFFLRSPHFEIKPFADLPLPIAPKSRKNKNPVSRVGLRHDMDGDIVTGLKCAQRLSARRIPGTFFVLHTSGYYGTFSDGVFTRYPGVGDIIRKFSGLKTGFGLHNDGLLFYHDHGIDGTEAVRQELTWLRSLGMTLDGAVAHNSAPAYGAENFEMFKGLSVNGRTNVHHGGVDIPLQTMSLSEENLAYEGNFVLPPKPKNARFFDNYIADLAGANIRNPAWQAMHFLTNPTFERDYDVSLWLLAEDSWLLAVHGDERRFGPRNVYWPLTTQSLKSHLAGLEPGQRIMVNIHPEYIAL